MPKRGLSDPSVAYATGATYLADISVPPSLYRQLSQPLDVPSFADGDILRLVGAPDPIGR